MVALPSFQQQSSNFLYTVELDAQVVTIQMTWNVRNESWHLTVTDGNGNTIDGIKCVQNFPLLRAHKGFTDLRGDFFLQKITSGADEITYDNLSNIWQLQYYNESELAEWVAENGI